MFSVLFEVRPKGDQWDAYLGYALRLTVPQKLSKYRGMRMFRIMRRIQ